MSGTDKVAPLAVSERVISLQAVIRGATGHFTQFAWLGRHRYCAHGMFGCKRNVHLCVGREVTKTHSATRMLQVWQLCRQVK